MGSDVCPAKSRIRLRIRAVWSGSSFGALWVTEVPGLLFVNNEDSNRSPRMYTLWFWCTLNVFLLVLTAVSHIEIILWMKFTLNVTVITCIFKWGIQFRPHTCVNGTGKPRACRSLDSYQKCIISLTFSLSSHLLNCISKTNAIQTSVASVSSNYFLFWLRLWKCHINTTNCLISVRGGGEWGGGERGAEGRRGGRLLRGPEVRPGVFQCWLKSTGVDFRFSRDRRFTTCALRWDKV